MSGKLTVMVVDDDKHIAELISLQLINEGYDTKEVYDGKDAVAQFSVISPHLVILDVMLPGQDGYQVLSEIRRMSSVPVIMLTAKGETFDKVLGLELGADDYMVKPFDRKELLARVKAVLRRYEAKDGSSRQNAAPVVFPNLSINPSTYTVTYHGEVLELPPKEFELLHFLAQNANLVFSRDQLLDRIWGYEFMGETRTVDVHIKRIRQKMTKPDNWGIKTVWGVGYKFDGGGM